jgi:small subunit ribosomal protein S6
VNQLRTYEALYIVRPDLQDDEVQTIAQEVENLVTSSGGAIVRSEVWGKRKLAYMVKHFTEGHYILLRFQADPEFVGRLEQYFRLSEAVIRDLVVYFDEKTLRLEEEQQKRKQAEVQASGARAREREEERGGPRRRDEQERGGRGRPREAEAGVEEEG